MCRSSKVHEVPNMTNRYTDAEWSRIISDTQKKASVLADTTQYACPEIGSVAFTKTIDHTLLKLDATRPQFDVLCSEARVHRFATVCVRPEHVEQCVANLKGSDVRVASVIGFHEGTYDLSYKLDETTRALAAGATELDLVLNYPQLLAGDFSRVYTELAAVRAAAPPRAARLKLILETSALAHRPSLIVAACALAAAARFDFVKTSTGFHGAGAQVGHVRLMRACCDVLGSLGGSFAASSLVSSSSSSSSYLSGDDVGNGGGGGESESVPRMRVKASGGIRTLADAVAMLEAGAERLGTSNGVWIAKEAAEEAGDEGGNKEGKGGVAAARSGNKTRLFSDY